MSKASEWARTGRRKMRFRERLTKRQRSLKLTPLLAEVTVNETLDLGEGQILSPDEARRFARWILDTFGEAPA